jgi:hypothetical protein
MRFRKEGKKIVKTNCGESRPCAPEDCVQISKGARFAAWVALLSDVYTRLSRWTATVKQKGRAAEHSALNTDHLDDAAAAAGIKKCKKRDFYFLRLQRKRDTIT